MAAMRLQARLARLVACVPLPRMPRLVAGGDAAFADDGRSMFAGWVVWDARERAVVEEVVARRPVRFPYVPGLLSFRETPGMLAAARKLRTEPDLFMLDGQGLAHPRRFGLACHVGLLLGRPTLGCAKSRLCGVHDTPADVVGASKPLTLDGDVVGRVLRMRPGVNPVYVSVGHLLTLEDAVRVVLRCCTKFRLPEPTRLADQLVARAKRG